MKIDVFKRKQRFLNWKERVLEEGVPDLSMKNSDVLIHYILERANPRNDKDPCYCKQCSPK